MSVTPGEREAGKHKGGQEEQVEGHLCSQFSHFCMCTCHVMCVYMSCDVCMHVYMHMHVKGVYYVGIPCTCCSGSITSSHKQPPGL